MHARKATLIILGVLIFAAVGVTAFDLGNYASISQTEQWQENTSVTGFSMGLHQNYVTEVTSNNDINVYDKETGDLVDTISKSTTAYEVTGVYNDTLYVTDDTSNWISAHKIGSGSVSLNSSYNFVTVKNQSGVSYLVYITGNYEIGKVNLETGEKIPYHNMSIDAVPYFATEIEILDNGNILLVHPGNNNVYEVSENGVVWNDTLIHGFTSSTQMGDISNEVLSYTNYSTPEQIMIYSIDEMVANQEITPSMEKVSDTIPSFTLKINNHGETTTVTSFEQAVSYTENAEPKGKWSNFDSYDDASNVALETGQDGNMIIYQGVYPETAGHYIRKSTTDMPVSGGISYTPPNDNGGSEEVEYNPNGQYENYTAIRKYETIYNDDGDDPKAENDEYIVGFDSIGNDIYWNVYMDEFDDLGSHYTTFRYRANAEPGSEASRTVGSGIDMGEVIDMDSEIVPVGDMAVKPNTTMQPINMPRVFFATSANGPTLVSSNGEVLYLAPGKVIHNEGTTIDGFSRVKINGRNALVIMADGTYIYFMDTETKKYIGSRGISNTIESFTSDSHVISYFNEFGGGAINPSKIHVFNNTSGQAVSFNQNLLAQNNEYVVVDGDNNNSLIYDKQNFGDIAMAAKYQDRLTNETSIGSIPNPNGVPEFDKGFYEGNHWFFVSDSTNEIYVYNKGLTDKEAVINEPWDSYGGQQDYFESYVYNGTVRYATSDINQLEFYDTQVEVTSGCEPNFNPHTLQSFWETPSVCWLPIFVGKGLLVSIYQWLMLAILISMPIAKETRSEIATMATIDGVLLIGMLIGTISPGFVAVAILATILLSVYGMSGTDVEINNMGGGGI